MREEKANESNAQPNLSALKLLILSLVVHIPYFSKSFPAQPTPIVKLQSGLFMGTQVSFFPRKVRLLLFTLSLRG